jgi:uroporphyrinogen-III decarboxylase
MSMTSRERVVTSLNHRTPDRVPVDFGGTAVTGMHASCVAALREYFGLEQRPVKVHEPYQMLGWIEDDLVDALGIDTAAVCPPKTMFGFPLENWKPWRTQQGLDVLVPGGFNTTVEPNGGILIYPEGDTSAPPSGRMPKGGFYFDTIVRQEPIDEHNLRPEDNLQEFAAISDADLAHFKREVARASATGRAVVATFGGTAFGDIALVPAPFLKHPKGIRDIAEWYMSTVMRQEYVHAVFARQTEIALANLAKLHAAVGNAVDVVFVCGTDFGTQTSAFCSPETFGQLYQPYYHRINDWIHKHTTWKTFKHSCGAVSSFMPGFIDSGFDIVNPVQCSAVGMDAPMLKARYGNRLTFWGGGADTQRVLPFGTSDEVREHVLRQCEAFAPGGGFIFNTVHNIQIGTPTANIVAMFNALGAFNGRR